VSVYSPDAQHWVSVMLLQGCHPVSHTAALNAVTCGYFAAPHKTYVIMQQYERAKHMPMTNFHLMRSTGSTWFSLMWVTLQHAKLCPVQSKPLWQLCSPPPLPPQNNNNVIMQHYRETIIHILPM
jgi:hypothetical protein